MPEVEPQRPEAGSTTDPIAPTEPAVGMRTGRWLADSRPKNKKQSRRPFFVCAPHRTRSTNNETTTTARRPEPELRGPRPDPSDGRRSRKLARSLVE